MFTEANSATKWRGEKSIAMARHAVVIAGGGPTGLMLAGELALAGVDVAIVERRSSQDLVGLRAGGLHSRTIEVFDQRGIAERFLSQGQVHQVWFTLRKIPLDISAFPTRRNYYLGLWQHATERILAGWVDELGVPIYRGREVIGFAQDDSTVDVALSDRTSLQAEYLVGCDGGRSVIRKAAGIEFAGWDPTMSWLIAEAKMTETPAWGVREDDTGTHAIAKLEDGRAMRVVLTEQQLKIGGEPTPRRCERGAHRRIRDRLRDPQSHFDLQVHRPDSPGRHLS
jgi:3-(3-hydroxy-phenyl)propionate hydroxylase